MVQEQGDVDCYPLLGRSGLGVATAPDPASQNPTARGAPEWMKGFS